MNAMEWAFKAVLEHLKLDPEKVKSDIASFGQIVADTKAQLDRIERTQELILQHFKIPVVRETPVQIEGLNHEQPVTGSSIPGEFANGTPAQLDRERGNGG